MNKKSRLINQLMCKIFGAVLVLFCAFCVIGANAEVEAATTFNYPTQQYRAVWISHFASDLSAYTNEAAYKTQMNTVFNRMEELGLNAMVFHIRTHNNALYDSDLNPVASWYKNVNFAQFDPLAWIIEECHKRGIEFHAWLNPYRVLSSTIPGGGYSTLEQLSNTFSAFPENPANKASNLLVGDESVILDPGIPEVRDYIVRTCLEIVEKYDVDAIHFDDYFYVKGNDDSATRAIYNTTGMETADFRREQVNIFIKNLHEALQDFNNDNGRTVQLGISPSGIYRNGTYSGTVTPKYDANGTLTSPLYSNTNGFDHYGDYLYSDTKKWIDEEWIDYITPQSYWGINHTIASFKKLTEWWSWVVRYKGVNLYMGHGIYMADTNENTGSFAFWKDPLEINNQLLDIVNYPEIDGSCYYKYSTFNSSQAAVKGAVSTLKSFYDKKIPSSVVKSMTYLPEIDVENVSINGTTLSWNNAEDVRGYVVWQVPFGQTPDTKNYAHFYKYVTSNSVTITSGYDYYVSSVNMANEFSEPVTVSNLSPAEKVTLMIANLKQDITLADEASVQKVRNAYEALNANEKDAVLNYSLLLAAEAKISDYKVVQSKIAEIGLPKQIKERFLLPTYYEGVSITWSYVDLADALIYDIASGKVLIQRLATTNISLKLEATYNGVTHGEVKTFNVGLISGDVTALYYRNDSAALSKSDGDIGASYIGWSNYILEFTLGGVTYQHLIAATAYLPFVTPGVVPTTTYTSVALVYQNMLETPVTYNCKELSITSSYGYFIISAENVVREAVITVTSATSITLAPGEVIVAPKYLDTQIAAFNITPVTQFIDKSARLFYFEQESDVDSSQIVIDEIDKLPASASLALKDAINRAWGLYQGLSPAEKAKVTNFDKLDGLYKALNSLIEEENARQQAIQIRYNELANYLNQSLYSTDMQGVIRSLLQMAEIDLKGASSIAEMDEIVIAYKSSLDDVLTQAEEDASVIVAKRADAVHAIYYYITDVTLYSNAKKNEITQIIEQYIALFEKCDTLNSLTATLLAGKAALDAVPTMAKELSDYRKAQLIILANHADQYNYSQDGAARVIAIQNETMSYINSTTSYTVIDSLVADACARIDAVITLEEELEELNYMQINASSILMALVNISNYANKEKSEIVALVNNYSDLIAAATTYKSAKALIAEATAKLELIPVNVALFNAKEEAIEGLNDWIGDRKLSSTGETKLAEAIEEYTQKINDATTVDQVETLLTAAKKKIDTIAKDYPQKETSSGNCNFGTSWVIGLSMMGLLVVLLKKKEQ